MGGLITRVAETGKGKAELRLNLGPVRLWGLTAWWVSLLFPTLPGPWCLPPSA